MFIRDRKTTGRGPEGKLNLKAQNLAIFLQIADGLDDETWLFHLKNGDIARWFPDVIKDGAGPSSGIDGARRRERRREP